jgi:hypothetical protein
MPTQQPDRAYDPKSELDRLGIPVLRVWLRDTSGVWVPRQRVVVVASGLGPVEERCVLAHEVEHVLAGDGACGEGPVSLEAEHRAELQAARKLVPLSDLYHYRQSTHGEAQLAERLRVTPWVLRIRLADLEGGRVGMVPVAV